MRDDFPKRTQRILADRVNSRCSNPDCGANTRGPHTDVESSVNIGVAAHITAASTGGPRFDGSLTGDERAHFSNGIWLCESCAKLIDSDEPRYTVETLRAWKQTAEEKARA